MTKEQLSKILNGRQYLEEITEDEEEAAKKAGLVVLFGASDDLAEFRGAITDEAGCYEGRAIRVNRKGVEDIEDDDMEVLERFGVAGYVVGKSATIKAVFGKGDYTWTYDTELPHATFEIIEEAEKYCRGIVFSIEDLPK